jgi:hypothetical protein
MTVIKIAVPTFHGVISAQLHGMWHTPFAYLSPSVDISVLHNEASPHITYWFVLSVCHFFLVLLVLSFSAGSKPDSHLPTVQEKHHVSITNTNRLMLCW